MRSCVAVWMMLLVGGCGSRQASAQDAEPAGPATTPPPVATPAEAGEPAASKRRMLAWS